jgi:hypothetical protein
MTLVLLAAVVVTGLLLSASLRRRGTLTRRRAVALIACAALATLVVESDAVARRIAVQRATEVLDGCVSLGDASLDLGSFPVAARALRGHLDNVTVDADTVDISGLRLRELQGRVHRVRYELLGSLDDVDVERATVSARVEQHDLGQLLEDLGLAADVAINDDEVTIVVGDALTVQLEPRVERGAAVLGLRGPLESLLALRFEIPGVTVTRIDATSGELHVDATVAGDPRRIACHAASHLQTQLQALSVVATLVPGR